MPPVRRRVPASELASYRARDHWHWPMTNEELEEKFLSCASKLLVKGEIGEITKTVYNLEAINDIGELMDLLII